MRDRHSDRGTTGCGWMLLGATFSPIPQSRMGMARKRFGVAEARGGRRGAATRSQYGLPRAALLSVSPTGEPALLGVTHSQTAAAIQSPGDGKHGGSAPPVTLSVR